MTEKEGKIINAGELPCTLQMTCLLLLFRSLKNCKSVDTVLLYILCAESAEAFPKVLYLWLGHSWFNWNQDGLEDMIFANLTWGLSYVHLQLGAKIVIRCMFEDSCKDFLSFWKVGLLLDIIVLPFSIVSNAGFVVFRILVNFFFQFFAFWS
jgi:hypothetical protein